MLKTKDVLLLVLAMAVVFLVGVVVGQHRSFGPTPAYGEGGGMAANGVLAVSGKVDANRERLYLIDTEKKVICVYDTYTNKFRLAGVRSYKYDVELVDTSKDSTIEDGKTGGDYEYAKKKFEGK
ncbi:MAG: hypothetical protein WC712_15245 [Candidatus Brocadiia bacterium]